MRRHRILLTMVMMISFLLLNWKEASANHPPQTLDLIFQDQHFILPLNKIGFDGIDPTTIDRQRFFEWIQENVEPKINQSAQSAYFLDGELQPHQLGRKVDRKRLANWLDLPHFYLGSPQLLPVIEWEPKLTTDQCLRLKEKKIGSYTTNFNKKNKNRTHNIYLSTEAIDHKILLPGETFSFNRVVGKRSRTRGYRQARVIVKGEYSEGIGGGICQTSSTLFNSVDQAGLQIIERYSHSKRVTYVPRKRDAAVSWYGPDFCFRNQLNEPIIIVTNISDGQLTIELYGPDSIQTKPRFVPSPPS
ncbi:Vancomycin resistance protein YoaR, contains peptidoglycan-binding and VanW domains [Seinonella peptonophila]|uniref:Vancomycin resistance protein YoaR, contains peptidoglycan-binding and VanW domains n=1 Tax=Seinonella peptonophila TaxID=112248 RepID=A0A1M4V2V9_9BACL|nr:VanW family protein [Seinonella peptonophila]SHE63269.1 Vancomycin resistance protein YoaR, contains peptidoglycan-binding and VanW domains [Seinonella peptonophila]